MESELSKKQHETQTQIQQIEQQEQQEVMGREGAFCKYNQETERCVYNPDENASANDEECYKTEKNRCASKNKMRKIKINPKRVKEIQQQQQEELVEEAQQSPVAASEAFCKYNEATERCVYNPDANATANDEECYKTEKNRCASKKNKMRKIKIKPKKATEVQQEEELVDEVQSPVAATEAFCKYNEATERCVYNPNASANDEECYKTEKNRCASKKNKMRKIKINPKRVKENTVEEIITDKIEEVLPPVKKKNKNCSK